MRIGIFPGSFDPVTNGHIDIINRALKVCDKLYVAVAINSEKKPFLKVDDRVYCLKQICSDQKIEVVSFNGLLSDFCKKNNISLIIRGLRNTADYEYETRMAVINSHLNKDVETVFFNTKPELAYISSSAVRELIYFSGDVSDMIPEPVLAKIKLSSN